MRRQKPERRQRAGGSSEAANRNALAILTLLLALYVLVLSFSHISSLDIGWHLKTGEWTWQQRAIPRADPFSHTAGGMPWISHEWLFGLLAFGIWQAGGATALVAAKSVACALLMVLAAWTARVRGARPGAIFLVLAASYAVARPRLVERPELLSLPLALGFLLAHEKSRSRPLLILCLPVAQVLWVNLHGGTALLGWVLAGALLLDRMAGLHAKPAAPSSAPVGGMRLHIAAFLGVVGASFLNPHGFRTLFYGLLRTESPIDNKEFQSFAEIARGGVDLPVALFVVFAVVLATGFLLRARTARPYEWLLFPFLLVLAVVFFRFRSLFVFLLAPALAWQMSHGRWLDRVRTWMPAAAGVLILLQVARDEHSSSFYRFGPGIHPAAYPRAAVEFLKSSGISGKMFNSYGLGGYLIWQLWPGQRVFIDGREDVYLKPGVLQEYVHAFDSRETWRHVVEKYDIDYAVVRYPEQPPRSPERSLDQLAFPRQEWALVYFDDVVVIYVRRNARNEAPLRHEIRTVQPLQVSGYLDAIAADPQKLAAFLAEMEANGRMHAESFRNRFTLGQLAVKRGSRHLGEALQHFEASAAINPDFAPSHINLGSVYLHLKRYDEAETAFRRALRLGPNEFVERQLGRIRAVRSAQRPR